MDDELIQEWVQRADADFDIAKVASKSRKKSFNNIACFHAQQCAEKYLKAFLVFVELDPPRTHDLVKLIELCKKSDQGFELIRDLARRLTHYAVETRYPGDDATKRDVDLAIRAAKEIRDFTKGKLP